MSSVTQLASQLQTLFGATATRLAQRSGCVRRERQLSGASFAQALVFGWLAAPASTLAQLAQACAAAGAPVSRQAVQQRFTPAAAQFLRDLLTEALQAVIAAEPVAQALLQRLGRVIVADSTSIALPAALADHWPGCGNGSGAGAAIKVQAQLELVAGSLALQLEPGRSSDRPAFARLPASGLGIADLGYFSVPAFAARVQQGGHVLSRLLTQTALFLPQPAPALPTRVLLPALLARVQRDQGEWWVLLGSSVRWPCRLLAQRVSDQEAALRLARQQQAARAQGEPLPRDARLLSHWLLLVTSLPADQLSFREAFVLYRLRWQVELLFKRWKSLGLVDTWRTGKPLRILCELYAKLLAALVSHWLSVGCGWQRPDKSLWQAAQAVQSRAPALLSSFRHGRPRLAQELRLLQPILTTARLTARASKPPAFQRLALLAPGA